MFYRNFKLLSFGQEAEEDEEQTTVANSQFAGKSKSTHDVLNDPKLSALPAVGTLDNPEIELTEEEIEQKRLEELENVRKKLQPGQSSKLKTKSKQLYEEQNDDEELEEYYLGKDKDEENKRKM